MSFKDFLPAGTRFRSIDDGGLSHNFTCSHNGAATAGVAECHGGILRGLLQVGPSTVPIEGTDDLSPTPR